MSTAYPPAVRDEPSVAQRLLPVGLLVAVMWVVEIVDTLPGTPFDRHGIRPRDQDGLIGIAAAPFLHAGFGHLIANTGAFLVLGGLIALTVRRFVMVTLVVAVLGGLGTWLLGSPMTVHVGASGLVYGYAAFLVTWGLLVRRPLALAVSVVVVVAYGGIVGGVLPGNPGISWEGHLCGALAGIVAAVVAARSVRGEALR